MTISGFIREWNKCKSARELADKLGVKYQAVLQCACKLRKRGFDVPKKSRGGWPLGKARLLEKSDRVLSRTI